MSSNVGGFDRVLRIAAGAILLTFAVVYPGEERWFGLIGLVPLATGLFRFCPAYTLLGINTCPLKPEA
ncbi:DUF2892 domain-containing protein [Ferrovibrio terrae]|jgi:cadmium resistance protein CadD (predicted permease)|uniref:YgaP family membrane protein n=1 Tax=Ferrovibrio terrae TaxID=2594003 RepID=UPI003137B4F4